MKPEQDKGRVVVWNSQICFMCFLFFKHAISSAYAILSNSRTKTYWEWPVLYIFCCFVWIKDLKINNLSFLGWSMRVGLEFPLVSRVLLWTRNLVETRKYNCNCTPVIKDLIGSSIYICFTPAFLLKPLWWALGNFITAVFCCHRCADKYINLNSSGC